MDFSKTDEICFVLAKELKSNDIAIVNPSQVQILVPAEKIIAALNFLQKHATYYFDFLNCITCIDNGPDAGTMDIVYSLSSIPFDISVHIKTQIPRESAQISSVTPIWQSANWHEREIFDLFGVRFTNHPDLRRILMPADWEGHPLRKDYEEQKEYHGIKVKY